MEYLIWFFFAWFIVGNVTAMIVLPSVCEVAQKEEKKIPVEKKKQFWIITMAVAIVMIVILWPIQWWPENEESGD